MHKKGISLNSVEKSLSHSADEIRGRTLLGFQRILVSKSFKQKKGGSFTVLSNFFFSLDRKFSPGNNAVFQKISCRQKYFMDKRGRGYHDFPSKSLSHCTKIFHWRTLWCLRKILLSIDFLHRGVRVITVLSKFFVSHDQNEKLRKGTLLSSGSSLVSKKNLWIRGGLSRFSVEIFVFHSVENFPKGMLLFLRKFLFSKRFMDKKVGITFFR